MGWHRGSLQAHTGIKSVNLSVLAIIPARGGSKGLPGKNIRLLNGLPMIAHTIIAALESDVFSQIVVTSDDPEILSISIGYGAETIKRPPELAGDHVEMSLVVNHVLEHKTISNGVDSFALLQPTSPLRNAKHIIECAQIFSNGSFNTAVGVCELEHPPQKSLIMKNGVLVPLTSWDHLNQNRQSLDKSFRQNGSMWFVNRKEYIAAQRFMIAPVFGYLMSQDESIDIDTLEDFQQADNLSKGIGK